MEIKKFIKYKGEKIPYVNTPLMREEIWSLRDNYDRFIINDVRRGTAEFYSGDPINKNYILDIDFKHVFYAISSIYAIYKFYQAKRKVKNVVPDIRKKVERNIEEFEETLNGWSIKEEKKKEQPEA